MQICMIKYILLRVDLQQNKEGYLMHTSNYYDVYNMVENEKLKETYGENVSGTTIEGTDNHNEII